MKTFDLSKHGLLMRNQKTLKETSKDTDNGVYLSESDLLVVSFDDVKEEYVAGIGRKCCHVKSVDALYTDGDDKAVFIEFKNTEIDSAISYEVIEKAYNSLFILMDIVGRTVSFSRDNISFIFVFSEMKNQKQAHKDAIARSIGKKAKMDFVKGNLDRMRNIYFGDVQTYTEKEFHDLFVVKHTTA